MKIFKSFGEFATIFLLLVIVVTCLMFWILKNGTSAKYKSLTNNAIRFSDVVSLNQSSFSNDRIVFLDEVIDGGYMSNIKSPFSTKNCDLTQSYVEIESSKKYVTLTCDNYVLKRYNSSVKDAEVYEVSDWKSNKKVILMLKKQFIIVLILMVMKYLIIIMKKDILYMKLIKNMEHIILMWKVLIVVM